LDAFGECCNRQSAFANRQLPCERILLLRLIVETRGSERDLVGQWRRRFKTA
jgi:hypothetical protein